MEDGAGDYVIKSRNLVRVDSDNNTGICRKTKVQALREEERLLKQQVNT